MGIYFLGGQISSFSMEIERAIGFVWEIFSYRCFSNENEIFSFIRLRKKSESLFHVYLFLTIVILL